MPEIYTPEWYEAMLNLANSRDDISDKVPQGEWKIAIEVVGDGKSPYVPEGTTKHYFVRFPELPDHRPGPHLRRRGCRDRGSCGGWPERHDEDPGGHADPDAACGHGERDLRGLCPDRADRVASGEASLRMIFEHRKMQGIHGKEGDQVWTKKPMMPL